LQSRPVSQWEGFAIPTCFNCDCDFDCEGECECETDCDCEGEAVRGNVWERTPCATDAGDRRLLVSCLNIGDGVPSHG